MASITNIRNVIEQSPKLWYSTITNVLSHNDGVRLSYRIDSSTFVDYENKTAKRTVITTQSNVPFVVKTDYADCQKNTCSFIENNSIEHETNTKIKMEAEEFDRLFSANGELRPILFDTLVSSNAEINIPNTLILNMSQDSLKTDENTNSSSNIVLSLCSADTLKLNSLVLQTSAVTPDYLVVYDTEMIIHLG